MSSQSDMVDEKAMSANATKESNLNLDPTMSMEVANAMSPKSPRRPFRCCPQPLSATLSPTRRGGPALFFYGTVLLIFVAFASAISLAELASAYPHARGQYFWVAQLAPPSCRRFLSYMTAIVSWASVVCVGASSCSATTNVLFEMIAIQYPTYQYHQWHGFLAFEAWNILAAFFNLYERTIPKLFKICLIYSVTTAVVFFIAYFAANHPKQSGKAYFAEYYNTSGWPNRMAFLIGISGVN
ncbi:hypothetical protein LTR41_010966 [Exophiala xenobiotica]|nr:hypothetical protein LTR41_010966 [Exophiala xenobiotica]KAK5551134.1 hypothetical protein LTR46_010887 [Exophiala xenobiotica]